MGTVEFGPIGSKRTHDNLVISPRVRRIDLEVNWYNKVNDRSERCDLELIVQGHTDVGAGRFLVRSELDSKHHVEMLKALRNTMREASKRT